MTSTTEGSHELRMTVFIVGKAREVRIGLPELLAGKGYQVQAFNSAERFIEGHNVEVPGCLVLERCLPGMNGLELQRTLAGAPRSRPLVFLTGCGDIESAVQAMKQGAVDVLTMPINDELLSASIEEALRRDARERQEHTLQRTIRNRLETLTSRERYVMERVISGYRNREIAAEIGIAEKTVKVHRGRVMSKMIVCSVPALVRLGVRVGMSMNSLTVNSETGEAGTHGVSRDSFVWR
jgi:FixJ family two-component response regulator